MSPTDLRLLIRQKDGGIVTTIGLADGKAKHSKVTKLYVIDKL